MKFYRRPFILASLLLLSAVVSRAQTPETRDAAPRYDLPTAHVGKEYSENILRIIEAREGKRRILKSVSDAPDFRWEIADRGSAPAGFGIDDDGWIEGTPKTGGAYEFVVEISDASLPRARPQKLRLKLEILMPEVTFGDAGDARAANAAPTAAALAAETRPPAKRARAETRAKFVGALISVLLSSDKEDAQIYAAEQLGSAGGDVAGDDKAADAIKKLVDLSDSSNPKVRRAAVGALARISAAGGVDALASVEGVVKDETNTPVPHAEVEITDAAGTHVATTTTNADGGYSVASLTPGAYRVAVKHEGFESLPPRRFDLPAGGASSIDLPLESTRRVTGGQFSRTILGFEQSGASASSSRRNFFLDLSVSIPFPIKQRVDPDFGPRTRIWGDARITSVPNPKFDDQTVQAFATSFTQNFASTEVRNVVQAAEFIAGVEYRLAGTRRLLPSFAPETKQKFSFNIIAGAGVVTPLTPRETSVNNIFEVSTEAAVRYPQLSGKRYVAFVSPDRDRFFRQYYAGLRFKTFYFDNGERPLNRFPGTLDLTFGQNEAITGGRLRGGIMRLEGFFPLPFQKLSPVFLFGTAQVKLTQPNIGDPLILKPADAATTPLVSPDTGIVTVPQINRDYYRLGIGIDALQVVRTIFERKDK